MAKQIPGKEEFHETIRYFNKQLQLSTIEVCVHTHLPVPSLFPSLLPASQSRDCYAGETNLVVVA